jgi:hypothetical protein
MFLFLFRDFYFPMLFPLSDSCSMDFGHVFPLDLVVYGNPFCCLHPSLDLVDW